MSKIEWTEERIKTNMLQYTHIVKIVTKDAIHDTKIHYIFKFGMTRHILFVNPLKYTLVLFAGITGAASRDYVSRLSHATLNNRDDMIPGIRRSAAICTFTIERIKQELGSIYWDRRNVSFPACRMLNAVKSIRFIKLIPNSVLFIYLSLASAALNHIGGMPLFTAPAPCVSKLKHFLTNWFIDFILSGVAAFFTSTCNSITSATVYVKKFLTYPFFAIVAVFKIQRSVMNIKFNRNANSFSCNFYNPCFTPHIKLFL